LALKPRKAVLDMAPYSPPSAGRAGKLRLDFNENTVGCSPRVIEFLKTKICEDQLSIYPEYTKVKPALANFFNVKPDDLLLTNGTDEAIQVLINTYIDDADEVIILRPSYAMYRFYAEVAGARIKDVDYIPGTLEFPLAQLLDAITPATRAILISNPNNPTGPNPGNWLVTASSASGTPNDEGGLSWSYSGSGTSEGATGSYAWSGESTADTSSASSSSSGSGDDWWSSSSASSSSWDTWDQSSSSAVTASVTTHWTLSSTGSTWVRMGCSRAPR